MERMLLVTTALPDRDAAQAIARDLVERRLAACVTLGAAVRSVYRWQGAIEEADEVLLTAKTVESRYAELEAAIRAAHPYEVPEIVAVPVMRGADDYLRWVADETRAEETKKEHDD
ncbi:MAG: divalent-cation tolerance protein CutA [Burkholderiaceae bacterium]